MSHPSYAANQMQQLVHINLKKSLTRHTAMHTRRHDKEFWYKCPKPGCKSSFQHPTGVDNHLRIHQNDLKKCMYCPYRYVTYQYYQLHLNAHFDIREFECDQCDLKFTSKNYLTRHYQKHEGIIYCCLICNTYETDTRHSAEMHMRINHAKTVGKNVHWQNVQHHWKIK